jgi:hypothetical protein
MHRTRTAPLLAGEGATLEAVPTTIHSSRLYIGVAVLTADAGVLLARLVVSASEARPLQRRSLLLPR